mmetsp:Transcript_98030/g.136186  ORF Transcript_98030/g.136186 Transcript_98030/m.136186 type:complete len:116 (-) Transcript_98030:72-419(-)
MQDHNTFYKVEQIQEGDGKNFPKKGNTVTCHYTGTFPGSGKKFDSSRDRNKPFQFKLGMGQVIKGWDDIIGTLSKGQRVSFTCPPECAYGDREVGGGLIPANSTLIFDVELISFE